MNNIRELLVAREHYCKCGLLYLRTRDHLTLNCHGQYEIISQRTKRCTTRSDYQFQSA